MLGSLVDGGAERTISYDNASLRTDRRLNAFYGLGGPRILVSHPFRGKRDDLHHVYNNSVDVVTSLNLRRYHGTFHFLDYVEGLDYELAGFPAWALWFSVIASHSDLCTTPKPTCGGRGPDTFSARRADA